MSVEIVDKDLGWKKFKAEMEQAAKKPHAVVGVWGEKASETHANSVVPNILIATVHEFGTDQIPERSYIRNTVDLKGKEIESTMAKQVDLISLGKATTETVLERLGLFVKGLIQRRISDGIPPPLKEKTIERKKSSKPLVDTGQLRASILHEVRKGTDQK